MSRHRRAGARAAAGIAIAALGMLGACTSLPGEQVAATTVAVVVHSRWTEDDPRGFVWENLRNEEAVEERFAACLRQSAASAGQALAVLTGTQFRAAVFPDLDPRLAPRSLASIRSLIPDPRFRSRIDDLAVLGGEIRSSGLQGGITCVGGYMAAACFGRLWRDHASELSALLIDLRLDAQRPPAEISARDTGWFVMLGVLPIGAPSAHEDMACRRFGDAVAAAVRDVRRQER
jgi:hypothetical protein